MGLLPTTCASGPSLTAHEMCAASLQCWRGEKRNRRAHQRRSAVPKRNCLVSRAMAQLPRPADVDVAAREEDGDFWEETLDVDDSDLRVSPTSSSRAFHPSSAAAPHSEKPSRPSHCQRIPGPASAIQDARRLRESCVQPVLGGAHVKAADADFLRHPWLCALQFLGNHDAWVGPGIKRIKTDRKLDRAPLVVGVVTTCKPNGLGDLFLTLKDPSDTISASVHWKVLSEGNVGQDISVGCVIVLAKVVVFRPSHSSCYLNITKGKVVKVVRKDYDPPFKQDISSDTTDNQVPGDIPLVMSEGTASIFSKMVSRPKHSQVADFHSECGTENIVGGGILGLDRSETLPNYSASQQLLKSSNSINSDTWQQRQGGNLSMFETDEPEHSASIIMGRLGREKMMPSSKDLTLAEVSCDHQRMPDSSNNTSKHKSSSSTDRHAQQSFNTPNRCSQGIPDTSSAIPRDRACTQVSNNEKLRLPFADEIMLPCMKKPKANAAPPHSCDAAIKTTIDTKSKHGLENNMDIDMLDMVEPFHSGHATCRPAEHQQNDFCAPNTGIAQATIETSATDASANNGSLLSDPKRAISVASGCTDWTDEQLSELFIDY